MKKTRMLVLFLFLHYAVAAHAECSCEITNPLSKINILGTQIAISEKNHIEVSFDSGSEQKTSAYATVSFSCEAPTRDDWIGVFSPANFMEMDCKELNPGGEPPSICRAPIKFQYARFSNPEYESKGQGSLKLQLVNQRSDYALGLFTGGLANPKLLAVSNRISFTDQKAPAFPRLAQGREFNEMTVTWTSGYGIEEADPFVEFGRDEESTTVAPAGTLTFDRRSMCGEPARTVGWREPGFIHTCFLKDLMPNQEYTYRVGHRLADNTYVFGEKHRFKASPYPGQNSVQRIALFGSMGKAERDGSTETNEYQPGSLNTTNQLVKDLANIDMVFHLGDLSCAQGFLSQWDQFTAQIEPIASAVPYMIASGNRDRAWPNTGSFYPRKDSGGECGVAAETMFYVPSRGRAVKYATDFGMFRFCVADSEHDWREGTEQYRFLEHCLSSVDRRKQPWLIFLSHRALGYSSEKNNALQGSFGEPMGRDSLEKLLQRNKVDIAMFGHSHHYERTCPAYQTVCTNREERNYRGMLNGTINVMIGGGGAPLSDFSELQPRWSLRRDKDFGFGKLTAMSQSSLLFEYKRSSDGKVVDSFTIDKEYRDILACAFDSCQKMTLAA